MAGNANSGRWDLDLWVLQRVRRMAVMGLTRIAIAREVGVDVSAVPRLAARSWSVLGTLLMRGDDRSPTALPGVSADRDALEVESPPQTSVAATLAAPSALSGCRGAK